jgi:hypothetical protein
MNIFKKKPAATTPTGVELAQAVQAKREALVAEAAQVASVLSTEIQGDQEYVERRRRAVEAEAARIAEENLAREEAIRALVG